MSKKKICLVLGSGGARGWAHIGAIRALQENDFEIKSVVGCSMGALVGAAFAAGKLDELEETAKELDFKDALSLFFEFSLPRSGLVDGSKIIQMLRKKITSGNIEDMPIPFRAVSTDLNTGKEIVLSEGDVLEAVRASIAIPGIFTPVFKGKQILADGGLVSPVPVKTARELGLKKIIAVNVNSSVIAPETGGIKKEQTKKEINSIARFVNKQVKEIKLEKLTPIKQWVLPRKTPNIFDIVGNSTIIIQGRIAEIQLAKYPPDILIEPNVYGINFMEFHKAEKAISKGYEETIKTLEKQKKSIFRLF